MHERAAVANALRQVVERSGRSSVTRVVLNVGADLQPETVQLYWRELARGTNAADASLEIERAADVLVCTSCAKRYFGTKLDCCPRCGSDGLIVEAAPEVAVAELRLRPCA
jgi:Zn finger protein HypA/HybF involved in hydrogenase expression